jgi:hypothetical protein
VGQHSVHTSFERPLNDYVLPVQWRLPAKCGDKFIHCLCVLSILP